MLKLPVIPAGKFPINETMFNIGRALQTMADPTKVAWQLFNWSL